jgi:hypothetical protein
MATKQAKVVVETIHHDDGGFTHELRFTNGQVRKVAFSPYHELIQQFAAHGAKAKLLAAANSADDADTAVQKVDALVDAFDEGKWSQKGEGGSKFTPLVRALAELKGIEPEAADIIVKGLSKSAQAKLRATERIATIIARIKGEEGKAEGDEVLDLLLKEEDKHASQRVA